MTMQRLDPVRVLCAVAALLLAAIAQMFLPPAHAR